MAKKSAQQVAAQELRDAGPLAGVFPCSESRILDHMIVMKYYDYSIADISEISGVGIKTALRVVHKLESEGILLRTRNVGRAIMFKLNPDSKSARALERLMFQIAHEKARELLEG